MRWTMVLLVVLAACSSGAAPEPDSGEAAAPVPSTAASDAEPPTPADTLSTTQEPASTQAPVDADGPGDPCAHVIDATMTADADGRYTVSATVSSADTGWDKYADLWTVSVGGVVIAERVLTHPHETEQPFTRSLAGVELPDGTSEIEIAARDTVAGFCGDTFVVAVLD